MLKKDNLVFGLTLGFITPIVAMFAYYLIQFRLFKISEFFQVMMQQKSLMSGIISISLLANAVIFTLYINKHIDKTARGIFIATCVYALVALGIKWFG